MEVAPQGDYVANQAPPGWLVSTDRMEDRHRRRHFVEAGDVEGSADPLIGLRANQLACYH